MMKVGMSIVNKGVALKRYSLILVVFLIMMCLSFHFQFNEANASTKSDKLDVQQTSQQPVVKQQNKSVNVSKDKVVATQTKVKQIAIKLRYKRQWHLLNEHMLLQHM